MTVSEGPTRRVLTRGEEETRELGRKLASLLRGGDVVLLVGELGTGKTRLAKGLACGLGIKENILSPTFTLLKQYQGTLPLYHLDAYRLESARDLYDIGLEEYLEGGVLLVEWGERVRDFFHPDYLEVKIDFMEDDEQRIISLIPVDGDWLQRLDELDLGGDHLGRQQ